MTTFDCLEPTLNLQGYHALEASAGTGKTFAIEHLVTRLILEGFALDDILIVTFTRAATRELRSRIRANLESLFVKQPPYIENLSDEEKIAAQLKAEEGLALFDEAQIFTIHAFCQRMLMEFGFEAQVGLSLLSQQEESYRDLLIQEITDFFHTQLPPEAYSAKQLAALLKSCNYDKNKLVKKVLHFVEQEGEFPDFPDYETARSQFLSLDLPKLSLETLLQRAPAFLKICNKEGELKEEYQAQFQALLANDFDALLTQPSLFSFFTPANRSRKEFSAEELHPLYILNETVAPIIEAASKPQHTLIRIARDAKQKVRQALLDKELFSPDDLLLQMQQALSYPSFCTRVHDRYKAVIIDEFQDTDTHQWNIFKTLFVDRPIQAFYIVGDPKQSIYGFRSADLNTYLQAKEAMNKTSHLTTNYRSEPQLLSSLNLLFSKQAHFPYTPVLARPHATDTPFSDEKSALHFFSATVEKKRERTWPSPSIEADYFFPFIAQEIQTLTQKKEATFSDFAILVKDRYQAARLKNTLEALNIPTAAKGTEPLAQTSMATFFKSFLSALGDPKKTHQLLAHPIFDLTHHELKTNQPLLSHAIAFMHQHAQSSALHKTIDAALHHHWKPNQTLLELLVQEGKLDTYSDFMQLTELLLEEPNQMPTHLLDYLEKLPTDQIKTSRRPLSDQNAVTIMTIHMSKGLEFPIVFALGLINRYTSRQDFIRHEKKWLLYNPERLACQTALQDQEAEKMRQLYVALTRAKKRLYIPTLEETSNKPPLGTASPLELLLSELPPLQALISEIGATQTPLKPATPTALPTQTPTLHPPLQKTYNFPSRHIHSFSSLTHHTPPLSPETPENALPKGTATGLLLHDLLEKIIREKLTHPYQKTTIHNFIETAIQHTPFYPYLSQITFLIDCAFHHPLDNFCLADVRPSNLHPEIEFLYSQTSETSLKGFADLIFFHENSYYILDWKTNLLTDYAPETLHQAMEQHEYFLQAEIYLEALKRYLNFKKDPHPIKGAYYLFLRGLPEGQGLYTISCPSKN
ncbi:UvrD-helicase domain-containing protein [Simkania sp.]|uniref:UvrD-helicase domain-containing protein n=1 Tax=Simkania sp. TaxID=34094 RepID=UPI003B516465